MEAEKDLVSNVSAVVRITQSFTQTQRQALERCVRIMSRGMAEFQENKTTGGLQDLPHLDRYCYHVAGVVGEMLTDLFCEHVDEVRPQRELMYRLAVSFGQGLQMTNILKDIWEDLDRGACWLPQDVFREKGFELEQLSAGRIESGFCAGLSSLIGIAQAHLRNALEYTLIFPSEQVGIRRFCLWALGMAVLTLRKIYKNLEFRSGQEVKITRRSVRLTVLVTNVTARQDVLLRQLFDFFTRGLPAPVGYEGIATRS